MISRFAFILWCALWTALPVAGGNESFTVGLLKYRGEWHERQNSVKALMIELMNRTSINADLLADPVTLAGEELFRHPFVLMTGSEAFPEWSGQEREQLRRFIEFGGTLLIDNSGGIKDGGFDRSVRRELAALFPEAPLTVLDPDHSIYRSFYLMNKSYFGGRVKVAPYLEGVTIDDYTPVVYSMNDAAGAWEKEESGRYRYDVIPGGEIQRHDAFKFGVNAILYSQTMNYKKDAVHVKALLRRKRR